MKCEVCGYTSSTDFEFCQNCGAKATKEALPDSPTPKIFACVKSNLYLVFCILIGASAVISNTNILSLGTVSGVFSIPKNLILLLTAIAALLIYLDGKKNQLSAKHFKLFSVGVLLKYIWGFFGGIAIMLIGALACIFPLIAAFFQSIEYGATFRLEEFLEGGGAFAVIAFIVVGILIILLGIIAIIINIIGRRQIHRFVKSVYKSVENNEEQFVSLKTVQFWLIAFTVIALGADLFAFLANPVTLFMFLQKGLYYAALIVAVIMINKYFKNENT